VPRRPTPGIDYAPSDERTGFRRWERRAIKLIGAPLLLLALYGSTFLAADGYASVKRHSLQQGMTRAQVDRQLSAFKPGTMKWPYAGRPGTYVVIYDLLWFGDWGNIAVAYNPDGTVWMATRVGD
jgi:hypothetical protein